MIIIVQSPSPKVFCIQECICKAFALHFLYNTHKLCPVCGIHFIKFHVIHMFLCENICKVSRLHHIYLTWCGSVLLISLHKSIADFFLFFFCLHHDSSFLSFFLCQEGPLMFTDHISMPLRSAFSSECLNCGYCLQLWCMQEHEDWALF